MVCPRCQHENPPLAKFCLECGQPVSAPPGRSSSPDAYTPKHLAEKILTSKSAQVEAEGREARLDGPVEHGVLGLAALIGRRSGAA
jgi:hypothetical protein